MVTKSRIAHSVADKGIPVIIANGRHEDIILKLIDYPEDTVCTRFEPSNI